MLTKVLRLFTSLALLFAAATPAAAQEFPTRTVRIIVPFPAGVTPDIITRMVAEELSKVWGQNVIIDNKSGASGILAMQDLKNSPADGHTYALADVGTHALNSYLYASMPYDPEKDLAVVTDLMAIPFAFFVPRSGNIRSMQDLVNAARSKPGSVTYATAGKGHPTSMAVGLLKQKFNLDMLEVPHKSGIDMITSVASGRVDLVTLSRATAESFKDRLLPIAFASDDRDMAGGIPTLSTVTGTPGFEITAWATIVARKETPARIIEKVRADMRAVFAKPAIRERILSLGAKPGGNDIGSIEKMMKADIARYVEVVKAEKLQKE